MITVETIDEKTFRVKVTAGVPTTHIVKLAPDYAKRLAPNVSSERLLDAAFRFLLEREPNTAILREFELSIIGSYFPEFEDVVSRVLEQG